MYNDRSMRSNRVSRTKSMGVRSKRLVSGVRSQGNGYMRILARPVQGAGLPSQDRYEIALGPGGRTSHHGGLREVGRCDSGGVDNIRSAGGCVRDG